MKPRFFAAALLAFAVARPVLASGGDPAAPADPTPGPDAQPTPVDTGVGLGPDKPALRLSTGTSAEFQGDATSFELSVPVFIEWGITQRLTVLAEPRFKYVTYQGVDTTYGLGDLVTAATFEFVHEGKVAPALAAEGEVKVPIAMNGLGTGKPDYSVGLVARKSLGPVSLDVRAIYTFVGSPTGANLSNTLRGTVAGEWQVSQRLDVLGEVAFGNGTGGDVTLLLHRGEVPESGIEVEGTVGLAEHVTDRLKLVQEGSYSSSGSKRGMFGLEWDFGAASTTLHSWTNDPVD